METSKLIDLIDQHLQEINENTEERVNRIKELLNFLNFSLKITELSDKEKEDFLGSMEGFSLTNEMRKTLDECQGDIKKNYYIEMWARSTYFRRCAWLQYLNGEISEKPSPLKVESEVS